VNYTWCVAYRANDVVSCCSMRPQVLEQRVTYMVSPFFPTPLSPVAEGDRSDAEDSRAMVSRRLCLQRLRVS
jgi:hypothetical protein